ncbi:MAG: signal peptidase II [Alphaproteobacteria bacterium]|nr:signal peptidase II [Alphaproteobacteria bacterium]
MVYIKSECRIKWEEGLLLGFATIVLALAADQLSKFFIDTQVLAEQSSIIVVSSFFNLIKVWNTGVSFSMFNGYGNAGNIALCVVALIISAVLLYWMWHENSKLKIICLGMIIGGALGNVIDRVHFGAVMDFLDFHYKNNHWPAFNLADSFICVGAFLLIVLEIYNGKKKGLENAKSNKF